MTPLSDLIGFLDDLLEIDAFDDLGPNGLQIPGVRDVRAVVTGVSGQLELFERAAELGAELVLVHHGILWDFQPRRITPAQAARLRVLLTHEIALAGYHLPLDAHAQHGNNALLAAGLGLEALEPFGAHGRSTIGVAGRFPRPGLTHAELASRVSALLGRAPLVQGAGPERIRTLGIISGAAAGSLAEAVDRGLDAFLTGEPKEHVMADAREAGILFLAAGHYATETLGIRRLGDLLADTFGIQHSFVDIPNPV